MPLLRDFEVLTTMPLLPRTGPGPRWAFALRGDRVLLTCMTTKTRAYERKTLYEQVWELSLIHI